MDNKIYNRLTEKEKNIISKIEDKAKKRRHKKQYTVKFIMDYITGHSFTKGWDMTEKADLTDLLKSVAKIAVKMEYFTEKQAKEHIDYYTKEFSSWFGDE